MNNCIGRRNYRFFFFFLISLSIHMMSTFFLCFYFVMHHKEKLARPDTIVAYPLIKSSVSNTHTIQYRRLSAYITTHVSLLFASQFCQFSNQIRLFFFLNWHTNCSKWRLFASASFFPLCRSENQQNRIDRYCHRIGDSNIWIDRIPYGVGGAR